ncbi:tetratricopeptide repeat protein [Methyloceanibacter sp.]|uniref:tetratricopeptide repeat protein n=1 Tax=Methyloceanibacter sp. TaxID=1965321 RepID=UPI002D5561FB|nr:tetratricopeptide repeat protein [Methyloceanibacter sp.]HZP09085.1 tetratricopeptide repeat protein [Methyloceanibacter sp.]
MVDIAASFSPVTGGFMQVLAEISAPSNWTALQNLFAAVLVLIVLGAIGTFLLGKVLRKDEEQSRIDAEQIAVMIAGKMVARSPEDGDRLSLKERNSIKALIGEAVVALREHTGWTGRRAIEKLKAGDTALAIDLFAERAEEKRRVAGKAAREASAALRHQAALTLPDDARAALALFQQAFELDPHDAENLLGLAVVQFRLGDIPSVEGLIGEARSLAQGSREDIIGLIDMFAGVLNVRSGKLEAAIEKFENAKRIFEAVDEPRALVDALMALASAQMKAGNLDGALANYGAAQALCTKNDYQLGLAQLHADLGLLLQGLGRFADAEAMLQKSFSIAEQQGEIAIAAVAAANLALLYRETHDLDRAEETIRQALAIETRLKHKDGMARGSLNLGTILFEKGRFAEAASSFQKSLDLYEELELHTLAANAVYNLGNAQRALNDDAGAERCYRKALDLFMAGGDAAGVARAAGNLGAVSLDAERFADAEQEFLLALDAAKDSGDPRAIAMQMRNLAVLAHKRGEESEACARLKESLEICRAAKAETEALELKVLMGQFGCEPAEIDGEEKQRA